MHATGGNWSSWLDMSIEYRESKNKIKRYRQQLREQGGQKTAEEMVLLELAGSMESDLNKMTAEMENRVLYQFQAMDEKDIKLAGLTERQKEIALLRQRYSYTEIGKMLGMAPSSVFSIYRDAVNKIKKYKMAQMQDQPHGLGDRQLQIYFLQKEGKSNSEIAEELGISINTVKTQIRIIKQKLGVNKLPKISCREDCAHF